MSIYVCISTHFQIHVYVQVHMQKCEHVYERQWSVFCGIPQEPFTLSFEMGALT